MGKGTAIEWATHTFNPWIGCTKISPECKNCYAEKETFVRVQRGLGRELWGPTADRHVTADANWRQPLTWNRAAAAAGERHRVFCASLADVAEDRPDLVEPRARLCQLILDTPHLDWLLLTKRVENLLRLFPLEVLQRAWVGTTAGTKDRMRNEVPRLFTVPARVRFISIEPLLEDVAETMRDVLSACSQHYIDWAIVGAESAKPGDNAARPMHPFWARGVRDVCQDFGIAFLFKQWGDWRPAAKGDVFNTLDGHTGNPPAFLVDLAGHVHCTREPAGAAAVPMLRVGKKAAGRLLDGRTWDELPEVRA